MYPQIFGIEHILYDLVAVILSVVGLIVIKKYVKSPKTLSILTKCLGGFLLLCIFANKLAVTKGNDWVLKYMLPYSFCSLSSYVLGFAMLFLKPDNRVYHYVFYIGLIGATITFFYPDFIGQDTSIFYINTITGLVHHSMTLFSCLYLLITKQFVPTLKKWHYLIIGFMCVFTLGVFYMSVGLFSNPFDLLTPMIEGVELTKWYFIGSIIVMLSLLLMWQFDKKSKK